MAFKTELDMSDVLGLIGNDIKIRVSPDGKHVILFSSADEVSYFYRLESRGSRQLSYNLAKLEEVKGNYHFTTLTEVRAIGSPTFDLGEW